MLAPEKSSQNKEYVRLDRSELNEDTISKLNKLSVDPDLFIESFNKYIDDCEKDNVKVCENPHTVYRKIVFYFNDIMRNPSSRKFVELGRIINGIFGFKESDEPIIDEPEEKIINSSSQQESKQPEKDPNQVDKDIQKYKKQKIGYHMEITSQDD